MRVLWDKNLLFGTMFLENCMKMKEIGLRGGRMFLAPHPLASGHILPPANGGSQVMFSTLAEP